MSINAWNPVCIHYLLLCPASFQAVKNNLCLKGMHKILIHYRSGLLSNTFPPFAHNNAHNRSIYVNGASGKQLKLKAHHAVLV